MRKPRAPKEWRCARCGEFMAHGPRPGFYCVFCGGSPKETRRVKNKAMKRKLAAGQCKDVNKIGRVMEPGRWVITGLTAEQIEGNFDTPDGGMDFCDAESEAWIWSIGVNHETGEVVASTGPELYDNPDYRCLWLR